MIELVERRKILGLHDTGHTLRVLDRVDRHVVPSASLCVGGEVWRKELIARGKKAIARPITDTTWFAGAGR
jgi:hypothetical protein